MLEQQEQAASARLAAAAASHDAALQRLGAERQGQLQAAAEQLLQPALGAEELEAIRAAALETAQLEAASVRAAALAAARENVDAQVGLWARCPPLLLLGRVASRDWWQNVQSPCRQCCTPSPLF